MGKSSAASASRRSSSPRGSTATDMETSSPSLLSRAGESGEEAYGQTLIKILQHPARSAHKQKTLGQRPQGLKTAPTDLPLALFLTWLQLAGPGNQTLNQSTYFKSTTAVCGTQLPSATMSQQ